jgi:predicted HicB family RNase H-like nuclease
MTEPGGRILVRLPLALHERLSALAREQGVSLNQLVVTLLAGGVGFKIGEASGPT